MIAIQTEKKWNVCRSPIFHSGYPFLVTYMDATRMEYIPEDCFDLIIDKALLDTFLCYESNLSLVQEYLMEIYRVLKTTGVFIVVSHGLPSSRLDYFAEDQWVVETIPIRKSQMIASSP